MRPTANADAENRLAYLADTVDVLFPGVNGTGPVGPMAVVPSTRAPRLLVPVYARRAAATAVRRYTAQQSAKERVAGWALAAGIRAGWCERLQRVRSGTQPGETICDHLSRVLGRPVVVTLALTRQRPNRKPVLQVFDETGATVAFAKVAISPLTEQLIAAEAAALATLADAELPHVKAPRVLDVGRWQGMPVLVTSPLPMRRAPRPDSAVLLAAMREVSETQRDEVAAYLRALDARATGTGSLFDEWRETFAALTTARPVHDLSAGAWHGDFTEWNCARIGNRLAVWDWERFAAPAPLGFDRLHYLLNHLVHGRRDRFAAAATHIVEQSGSLLAPWRLSAEDARTTALLYLLDIALRYLTDDLRSSDPGGHVERWAFPLIRANLSRSTISRGQ